MFKNFMQFFLLSEEYLCYSLATFLPWYHLFSHTTESDNDTIVNYNTL